MRINRVSLVAEMARKDMNIKKLTELSQVSRATITAVKSGKSCTQETAAKLAQGLGVPLESILEKEVWM